MEGETKERCLAVEGFVRSISYTYTEKADENKCC